MDEMGCEFVETSAHGGARPSHAEWQGRRFHRGSAVDYKGRHYPDFEAATGYGTGAGLCGWNCRHTFFAVFPELGDPPQWTRAELEALNARNIEWNGKKYTAYEISQMQRARERNVRRWKKRYLAEDAAGLDTTDSAVRLKAARQSLAQFAQATGGRVDSARTSVPKFGRSEASKAAWDVRHNTLTNAAGQTIIKVNRSDIKGPRNGITQKTNAKGGIDRNYYGSDGLQTKQISNNGHGHKAEEALGLHGEHAHDYVMNEKGVLVHGKARELTDAERKENSDIL